MSCSRTQHGDACGDSESAALPLGHRAPYMPFVGWLIWGLTSHSTAKVIWRRAFVYLWMRKAVLVLLPQTVQCTDFKYFADPTI